MTRVRFFLLFGLVLVLRVAVAARFRGNFDTQSFLIAVQSVVAGDNVYAATDRDRQGQEGAARESRPRVWSMTRTWGLRASTRARTPEASREVSSPGVA